MGLTQTSARPATTKTVPIVRALQPASWRAIGASTSRTPKKNAGSVLSQSPIRNAGSANAAASPPLVACCSRAGGCSAATVASRSAPTPTTAKVTRIEAASREGAEHRADDRTGDREPEHRAERLATPGAIGLDGHPRERAGPGHRAREPLDEARDAEGERGAGQREPDAREREHGETGDDGAARADPGRDDAAGNAAEQRAGAEGGEEDPRLELAQVEVLGVAGEEGHERAEEHRVDEHDDADEDEQAAHGASLVAGARSPAEDHGTRNAPSGWPLRPASRLTSAEAGADRGTINLRNSLLGARRNLGAAGAAVKLLVRKNSRNLRTNRIPRRILISPAPRDHDSDLENRGAGFRPEKENAPRRWLPRPAPRLTFAETTATRKAFNLRRSYLGAITTLEAPIRSVK